MVRTGCLVDVLRRLRRLGRAAAQQLARRVGICRSMAMASRQAVETRLSQLVDLGGGGLGHPYLGTASGKPMCDGVNAPRLLPNHDGMGTAAVRTSVQDKLDSDPDLSKLKLKVVDGVLVNKVGNEYKGMVTVKTSAGKRHDVARPREHSPSPCRRAGQPATSAGRGGNPSSAAIPHCGTQNLRHGRPHNPATFRSPSRRSMTRLAHREEACAYREVGHQTSGRSHGWERARRRSCGDQNRSNRSLFITLTHAATKSSTNRSSESACA